jgi:hypothetical protein
MNSPPCYPTPGRHNEGPDGVRSAPVMISVLPTEFASPTEVGAPRVVRRSIRVVSNMVRLSSQLHSPPPL